MTDVIMVDSAGGFIVGKAQTTPEDESLGFANSARDALGNWAKFVPPVVANGRVYLATFSNQLVVYGTLN